ncbi:ABC transporter permease [Fulvivirga sp. M361]|uniref:ABC transporter permease n=1 Tax=Fulvivirga sp. M361 TaxID=2594266 RepID=UPI001627917F|nr:ABC transporter permease [Fulvivirga sp. M361]
MLNRRQVHEVKKCILSSGISYDPVIDELVDHVCEEVEELLTEGMSFKQALKEAVDRQRKRDFKATEQSILHNTHYTAMIRNYIKLGIRSIIKYKLTTSVNLLGLTLGITVFMLIGAYFFHHNSFDRFHKNAKNIYRLTSHKVSTDGITRHTAFSGAPWGPELMENIAEVADMVRLMKYRLPVSVRTDDGEKHFYEKNLIWADNSFFSIFSFSLVKGSPESVLLGPNKVVLTESAAKKYFGDVDPMGKTVIYENDVTLTVTGVVQDFPSNSHVQADLIGSFATLGTSFWFNIIENWNILYYYTYIQTQTDGRQVQIQKSIQSLLDAHLDGDLDVLLQPITSIHTSTGLENDLSSGVSRRGLLVAISIALIILSISLINYVNLSNARAFKRAKEVGVIKVIGSTRWLVFIKFMVESFILAFFGFLISILAVIILFPHFRNFLDMELIAPPYHLIVLLGVAIILLVTVSAGFYTAFQMAQIPIVSALKRKVQKPGNPVFSLRKALITFQFIAGVGLLSTVLIISDQVEFLTSADTGFSKAGAIEVPIYTNNERQLEALKNKLSNQTPVEFVALSSHRMSGDQLYRSSYIMQSADSITMGRLHVDYDFVNTFDLKVIAGRNFNKKFFTDTSAFIINETAARLFGFKDAENAVGNTLSYSSLNENGNYVKTGNIIGLVKDFNFESLHTIVSPMVMDIQPARNHFLSIKLRPKENYRASITSIERIWKNTFPDQPFNYFFVNDRYMRQYQSETQLQKIIFAFSIISIGICALGLFALTYFDTTVRSKEICIRKVLGASTKGIFKLFIKDYVTMILISFVFVTPITVWLTGSWLDNFAYHVKIIPWNFIFPVIIIGAVVVITTGFILIKAANNNPTKVLNYE